MIQSYNIFTTFLLQFVESRGFYNIFTTKQSRATTFLQHFLSHEDSTTFLQQNSHRLQQNDTITTGIMQYPKTDMVLYNNMLSFLDIKFINVHNK